MRLPLRCAALTISLFVAACSHNVTSELPTGPTPPTGPPRILRLTITPPGGGRMLAGSSVKITSSGTLEEVGPGLGAYAQYSDGTGKYVEANWTSSDPGIAKVEDGSLVAVSRGSVTMTAAVQNMTATETFVVDPGIPGEWVGNYVVDDCRAGSGSVDELVCAPPSPGHAGGFLRTGMSAPIAMQITQNGKDLVATAQFGQLRGTLAGIDAGANFLSLKGDVKLDQLTITILILNARVREDVMDGVMAYEVRINGLPSWAAITAHFDSLARR